VSDKMLRVGRVVGALGRRIEREPVIAYVSGSNTHDRDLAMVGEPLARVLTARSDVRLLLCGHLALPSSLGRFRDRITHLPYQDWRAYPFALARCRVCVAPLAVLNDFTDAKSALKYLEAATVGVPTIASPSEPFREAIRDGDTGFLAETDDEWTERLHTALDGAGARRMGTRAHDDVRARFSFTARRGQLRALLAGLGGRADGGVPNLLSTDPDTRAGRTALRRRIALARRQVALLRGRGPRLEAPRGTG
jgi:glycosyltransferase involved in cell wall biosynthesis